MEHDGIESPQQPPTVMTDIQTQSLSLEQLTSENAPIHSGLVLTLQTVYHALQSAVIVSLELIQIARPDLLMPNSLPQELHQLAESVVITIFPTLLQNFVTHDMLHA